jgi:predicted DNA-binding protein YlxM (UPF0122 family)
MEEQAEVDKSLRKPLSKKMEKAARLVFEDRLTDQEIAAECGVTRQAIYKWKKRADFIARVSAISQAYAARALGIGIASRARRLEVLNTLQDRMLAIVDERCLDPNMQDVPGGQTGLIAQDYVSVRSESGRLGTVPIHKFDAALVREIRACGEQAAREPACLSVSMRCTGHAIPVPSGLIARTFTDAGARLIPPPHNSTTSRDTPALFGFRK